MESGAKNITERLGSRPPLSIAQPFTVGAQDFLLGGRDASSAEVLERLPEHVAASAPFVVDDLGGILAIYTQTHLPPDTLLGLTAKETGNAKKVLQNGALVERALRGMLH